MAQEGDTGMSKEEQTILACIPTLSSDSEYAVTSPSTRDYNCIAWALGRNDIWYWPPLGVTPEEDEYWPAGIADNEKIETLVQAMQTEGFMKCEDSSIELGYTKIALYSRNGIATHACRQLSSGLWTSKMGPLHDVQHTTPENLEGKFYGKVYCYMKCKI